MDTKYRFDTDLTDGESLSARLGWLASQDTEHNQWELRTSMGTQESAIQPLYTEYSIPSSNYVFEELTANSVFEWSEKDGQSTSPWSGTTVSKSSELWSGIYQMPLDPDVQAYLDSYPHLWDSLSEAAPFLSQLFPESPVRLRLVHHTDGWKHLFATILSELSADEAVDRMDQFDDNWFLDQELEVRERITFDVRQSTF